ncbi:MAG: hypothetical protein R3C05_17735 [Pirellulaceae bacterium]
MSETDPPEENLEVREQSNVERDGALIADRHLVKPVDPDVIGNLLSELGGEHG